MYINAFFVLVLGVGVMVPAGVLNAEKQNFSRNKQIDIPVTLTAEEKKLIKNIGILKIAGPASFPPFHYYNKEGAVQGIGSEYITIILRSLNINFEYQPRRPWSQVMEDIKNKETDIIACLAHSPEREKFIHYSHSFLSYPLVIITRKDAGFFVSGNQDLQKRKVALIPGNISGEWLTRDGIAVRRISVKSPLDALQAVSTGRADAYIGNLAVTSFLIRNRGLANLKVAAPSWDDNYELFIGVRKDRSGLRDLLNRVLAAMTPQQHSEISNRYLSIRFEHGLRFADILKWFLLTFGVVLLIVFIIVRWNRKLQKEINARILAEKEQELLIEELKDALGEVKTLTGLLPLCSKCKKIRDDQGYWNRLEEYVEKNSQASFSHSLCPECVDDLYGSEKWFKKKDQ